MPNVAILKPDRTQISLPEDQVRAQWDRGLITPADIYWKEGMPDWRPITEFFQNAGTQGETGASKYVFTKDPTGLTKNLVILLWASIGVSLLNIVNEIIQMKDPSSGSDDHPINLPVALFQFFAAILLIVVTILSGITFLRWIYRANLNARGFIGARGMKFTPGWSVGWYFIPFLNLVRPYEAVREIWQVSKNPEDWENQESPGSLKLWWGLWIASGILSQISFRISFQATDPTAIQAGHWISILTDLLHIPLSIVAVKIVSEIFQMQKALTERTA